MTTTTTTEQILAIQNKILPLIDKWLALPAGEQQGKTGKAINAEILKLEHQISQLAQRGKA